MNECYAVLLDTVSIQNYIFRSNRLKENLGASFLVEQIYDAFLTEALNKVIGRVLENEDLNDWRHSAAKAPECKELVEIGYIGGGNALLFFQQESHARQFIEVWTKILLIRTPGLITSVALDKFPLDPGQFRFALQSLFDQLKKNKNSYIPLTVLPRHGITAECASSELSAEIYKQIINDYVSADVNARIEAAYRSKEKIQQLYEELLNDEYTFSDELKSLGGVHEEDSHIAVVHIDGNDMGKLFKKADTLHEIRKLSVKVDEATHAAFKKVVSVVVDRYDDIMASLGFGNDNLFPKEKNKKVLPIRPIILGGDDVTFVCDARLGIYFAKIFIEEFEKHVEDGPKLTACAGISIVKTKYPFYRAYWLSEELCANAKAWRRTQNETASFLDFHISMGGIAGSLSQIREVFFGLKPQDGDNRYKGEYLLYRPLKIVSSEDERGLDLMLKKAWCLKKNFPKNKLADLRSVLTRSRDARKRFLQDLKFRGLELPKIPGHQYENELFENNITPYFDMLELLRFYPEFALKEIGENYEYLQAGNQT
jgi:hypothetical protein